ncbi:pyrroline-5-carboxylate reductase [Lederbergia panacisoli]|uniref:pyrroline-5-carboxylate reductase n=1 Tax=Lederbergia panacisoli TaxID=1255251 RepID=UPI00214B3C55|nr:pyrroline-5-carboxylate reductase [Lederbergia panacisoli]MCR2822862.1 pyrroline-5-carboxylate reductase [Lederbergia panacisoli]
MNKQIGFIGCGKMGQAMVSGMITAGVVPADSIKVSTSSENSLQIVKEKLHVQGTLNNKEIAEFADILFLAVDPSSYAKVIEEIKYDVKKEAVIIIIAAGISIQTVESAFGKPVKIVRTMPNTPSLVREGMTVISINELITEIDLADVVEILNSFGKTELMKEELMDAVPAISGSSPAYVYMFIEALADGGVRDGIPRKQAYKLAAQAVLGAAKMVLETENHPGSLKDDVCTPGGSTIRAVAALEESNFRSSILNAMKACTRKSKGLDDK